MGGVSCSIMAGERCCCSGACITLPCCEPFYPNKSGCCCCLPKYDEEIYEYKEIFPDVLSQVRTGDLIFGAWPCDTFGTALSRCMGHTRWSHIGIVYRPSDSPLLKHRDRQFGNDVNEDRPLIVEFVAGGVGERVGHGTTGGLDVLDLEVFVRDYLDQVSMTDSGLRAGVGVRFLRGVDRDDAFYSSLEGVVTKYFDTPFEKDFVNMSKSQYNCCNWIPWLYCWCRPREDTSSLFCSEFVAEAYKAMGLISKRILSADMIPPKFDSTRNLRLLGGATLSREMVVWGPSTPEERLALGYPPSVAASSKEGKKKTSISCALGAGGFYRVDVTQPWPLKQPQEGKTP